MKEKRDYLEARLVVLVNSLIFEIKIVKKINLKDEFGMENLKFNVILNFDSKIKNF